MGEETKPATVEETHTLGTNQEGDATETGKDGEAADGAADGAEEGTQPEGGDAADGE